MRLCFLPKTIRTLQQWFGTAFQRRTLPTWGCSCRAAAVISIASGKGFLQSLYAGSRDAQRSERDPPLETRTCTFSGWYVLRWDRRPAARSPRNTRLYQCIFGERFSDAILQTIQDPQVRAFIPSKGSVSQFLVESSGAVQDTAFCRSLKDDLTKS